MRLKLSSDINCKFGCLAQNVAQGSFFDSWSFQLDLKGWLLFCAGLILATVIQLGRQFESLNESLTQEFAELTVPNLAVNSLDRQLHDEVKFLTFWNHVTEEDLSDSFEFSLSAETVVRHIIDSESGFWCDTVVLLKTREHSLQHGLSLGKLTFIKHPLRPHFVL